MTRDDTWYEVLKQNIFKILKNPWNLEKSLDLIKILKSWKISIFLKQNISRSVYKSVYISQKIFKISINLENLKKSPKSLKILRFINLVANFAWLLTPWSAHFTVDDIYPWFALVQSDCIRKEFTEGVDSPRPYKKRSCM